VFVDGQWGTVCDDAWDASDAAVVCRQLGFSAEGAQALAQAYFGRNDAIRINMDDVACMGTEAALHDCAFVTWQKEDCSPWRPWSAAGVRCNTPPPPPPPPPSLASPGTPSSPTIAGFPWCRCDLSGAVPYSFTYTGESAGRKAGFKVRDDDESFASTSFAGCVPVA
jgi:hypothetical protein